MDKLNVIMSQANLADLTQEEFDAFVTEAHALGERLEAAILEAKAATAAKETAERRREMAEAQLMNPIRLHGGIPMQNAEGTDGELVYTEAAVRESLRLSGYPVQGEAPLAASIAHEWEPLPETKLPQWAVFHVDVIAPESDAGCVAGPFYYLHEAQAAATAFTNRTGIEARIWPV